MKHTDKPVETKTLLLGIVVKGTVSSAIVTTEADRKVDVNFITSYEGDLRRAYNTEHVNIFSITRMDIL